MIYTENNVFNIKIQPVKKSNLLVSIIIPMFNIEKYIGQCLDSILESDYRNYEVICIDDCSTDNTFNIVKNYAKKHKSIKLYKTNINHNIYAGTCRNIGIRHAEGDFLYFCDGDDYISKNLISKCVERLEKTNGDICLFNYKIIENDSINKYYWTFRRHNFTFINDKLIDKETSVDLFNSITPEPWNKFFRTSFIKEHNLKFQEIQTCNDVYFTTMSMHLSSKIAIIDDYLYFYRKNNRNAISAKRFESLEKSSLLLIAFQKIIDDIQIENAKQDKHLMSFIDFQLKQLRMNVKNSKFEKLLAKNIDDFIDKNGLNRFNVNIYYSISKIFDKIICIHYLPYKDRYSKIESELKRLGILNQNRFKFHFTVNNRYYQYLLLKDNNKYRNDLQQISWDFKNTNLGKEIKLDLNNINSSNISYTIDSYNLLKQLYDLKYEKVLIIEDDAVFLNDLNKIEKTFSNIPSDFDIVNFDPMIYKSGSILKENEYFSMYENSTIYNATCIALSRKAIKHIIDHQEQMLEPFDYYTWNNTSDLKTYFSNYRICVQKNNMVCQNSYMNIDKYRGCDLNEYRLA